METTDVLPLFEHLSQPGRGDVSQPTLFHIGEIKLCVDGKKVLIIY